MSIELLWIIPALALAAFFWILILSIQRGAHGEHAQRDRELVREVELFNLGVHFPRPSRRDAVKRLGEIEKTIELVTTALSNQQKIIENYKGKDDAFVAELHELKNKLLELQHEYDILLSENYSLRARIAGLAAGRRSSVPPRGAAESQPPPSLNDTEHYDADRAQRMRQYDDTRTFRSPNIGDTSQIDLTELHGDRPRPA